MSDDAPRNPIATARVLYDDPGTDRVTVRRGIPYRTDRPEPLALDVYVPEQAEPGALLPAVIIVIGYPGEGFARMIGCRATEMGPVVSWARLLAASGLAAITYENATPADDFAAVLAYVHENAAELGVDTGRIGLFASSGNGPLALSSIIGGSGARVAALALVYPLTMDVGGGTSVADASAAYKFVNACAGLGVDDLSGDVPLLLVRAGRDEVAGLNTALDAFAAQAVARNLPLTFVNVPDAPHAFDLFADGVETRAAVAKVLGFLAAHLGTRTAAA